MFDPGAARPDGEHRRHCLNIGRDVDEKRISDAEEIRRAGRTRSVSELQRIIVLHEDVLTLAALDQLQ